MGSLVFDGQINANGSGLIQFKGVDDTGDPINFVVNALGNVVSGATLIHGTIQGKFGGEGGGGGSGEAIVFPASPQAGHSLLAGMPITETATGWVKSNNSVSTLAADGICGEVIDANNFTVQQFGFKTLTIAEWDALCGTSGGLVKGQYYWVHSVAGTYTAIQPSGLSNFQQVGLKALSSTDAEILLPSEAIIPSIGSSTSVINSVGAQWDSGSSIVVASAHPVDRYIDRAGAISGVRLLTYGGPGSCVVDITKSSFGSFPPVASICASTKPTIVSGNTYQDIILSGWTIAVNAGDVLRFTLVSCSTFLRVAVFLGF